MVLLMGLTVIWLFLSALGCQKQAVFVEKTVTRDHGQVGKKKRDLPLMGYSIQLGAFSHLANAVRLTASLERQGLDAYYYPHKKRLFKVRFGNYSSREAALRKAESLLQAGIIDEYYIVSPNDYVASHRGSRGSHSLRDRILKTAEGFIGIPYRWGGSSPDEGFDCSGLTMAVYRLNGLELPRSSRAQYSMGNALHRRELARGDLVFFATSRTRKRVSHVGIYAGYGRFIHAPGKGRIIRYGTLSDTYFNSRYVGGRSYL
jgi:cell wall-associated NlpC family hydrolase